MWARGHQPNLDSTPCRLCCPPTRLYSCTLGRPIGRWIRVHIRTSSGGECVRGAPHVGQPPLVSSALWVGRACFLARYFLVCREQSLLARRPLSATSCVCCSAPPQCEQFAGLGNKVLAA